MRNTDNPDESPIKSTGMSAIGQAGRPSIPALVMIVAVCSIIGIVATPADPISMFVGVVVLTLLGVGCYLLGVRHGQRATAESKTGGV